MATLLLHSRFRDRGFSLISPDTGRQMTNNEIGAATALVIIVDHEEWRVYELAGGSYDRRASNTLIFESEGVMRRVRNFPENWREMSTAALVALSWTA